MRHQHDLQSWRQILKYNSVKLFSPFVAGVNMKICISVKGHLFVFL